jgi:Protein of unknown function (DUF2867)
MDRALAKVNEREFYALQLRATTILAGVPLHDVWVVDLPPTHEPVTLDEFHPFGSSRQSGGPLTGMSRALLGLRLFLGRIFHLDAEPRDAKKSSFSARLTPEDRARSSVESGTSEGTFSVVYRFQNESMLELQNRTVHGALVNALVETATSYGVYLAVYALIDPFRRWLIYPSMLKNTRAAWVLRYKN